MVTWACETMAGEVAMLMKWQTARILTLVLLLGLCTGIVRAQDASTTESLGDVARQLKAQRAKSHEKSKLYTNDDLEALPPLPVQSMGSTASSPTTSNQTQTAQDVKPGEQPGKETGGTESDKLAAKAPASENSEEPHGEKYFRDRMSKLQDRLETDQRELDVLQQKLGQGAVMYYPNPTQGLYQESGPTAMSDVHTLQDKIAEKKKAIEADEAAIEELREQLRREGGDPGWLR